MTKQLYQIFVKPADKLIVPNPQNGNKPLASDGELVNKDRYFSRRIKDGDVVVTAQKPQKSKAK
tara:strand:+ start:85 stop:276 length:192 start_codon:yes stop_codon:yes gene_type:complete